MVKPTHGYYSSTKKSDVDIYLTNASRPARPDKFSKYRGVHKSNNPKKPYRVAICFKGRRFIGGFFETELEAAAAYNELALSLIGPRALINELP